MELGRTHSLHFWKGGFGGNPFFLRSLGFSQLLFFLEGGVWGGSLFPIMSVRACVRASVCPRPEKISVARAARKRRAKRGPPTSEARRPRLRAQAQTPIRALIVCACVCPLASQRDGRQSFFFIFSKIFFSE